MVINPRFPPLPSTRDILRMYQITAKKSLSQNFILDPGVLRRFVKAAGDLTGKYAIEVGPGPGSITRALLLRNPKQVLVIEKDARFIAPLQYLQESVGGPDKLQIAVGDCLYYNVEKLIPEAAYRPWDSSEEPPIRLIGNLPFNVATPFIIRLLAAMANQSNLYRMGRVPAVLTFQHEVAHRMTAEPHDPERCRLSVMVQNYAKVDYLYSIPGGAFVPPPEVDVGVVRLVPHRKPYLSSAPNTPLPFPLVNKVVTTLFHGKQKHIRTNISNLFNNEDRFRQKKMGKEVLEMSGLAGDRTAVSLTMDEIEKIAVSFLQVCNESDYHHVNTLVSVDEEEDPGSVIDDLNFIHPSVRVDIGATSTMLRSPEEGCEAEKRPPKFDIQF